MLLDSILGFPRVPMQRAYNWDCILPDVWGAGVLGVAISKFVQSVNFGEYNIDDIVEMKYGAYKKFFPGNMNITNPKITFVAPIPDVVSFYLHSWRNLIVDKSGFYQVEEIYKKNIYVIFYDRTGIPVNVITLIGTFPKTFPAYNLAYTSEDIVKYEIEFKVDSIKTGLSGFSSFIGDAGKAVGEAVSKISGLF
jgi:hypothetical protein